MNQVELGNDVFKAMVQSHTVVDLLISELEVMVKESEDFLDTFADELESQLGGKGAANSKRRKPIKKQEKY